MKTKTFVYVIYLILCALISILIANMGYRPNTWQWWIGCGCVWISFQCGRFYQKED